MKNTEKQAFNPYLPSFEYIPDGEPHVFGDRVYIYGSHDRFNGAQYCLNDYVCYSAHIKNLAEWKYEGVIYRKIQDPRNPDQEFHPAALAKDVGGPEYGDRLNPDGIHAMWAPDVAKGPDGRYYLYYCLDFLPEIAVAVCDTPAGNYEFLGFVRHSDGSILGDREGDLIQFDPGVLVDDDNRVYLYSGGNCINRESYKPGRGSQVMELCSDMLTIASEPKRLMPGVTESQGTGYEGHELFEASSIRKINGKYYFVYSSVNCHELCYAVSDRPDRGYKFCGTLVDMGDVFLNGRTAKDAVNCLGNTHGGIECIDGQWYVFYHRQTNRTDFSRQGCAEKIYIQSDGSIPQAEVTSCGLNPGPLRGKGNYPARIACHVTRHGHNVWSTLSSMGEEYPYFTQDLKDMDFSDKAQEQENRLPVQYVHNIKDGSVIGYKYFDFYETTRITVKVRGSACGRFEISTQPSGRPLGKIDIKINSPEWQELTGEAAIPKGVYGLYFNFHGSGSIDLVTFTLE